MLYKSFTYRQRVNKWSIKVRTSNSTGFHIFIAFSRSWRALILNNGYNDGGMLLNAAFVDTTLHKNVSRASPRNSPWVASDPVRDSVEAAPADNDYTVIHTQVVTCHIIVHPIPMLDEKDVTLSNSSLLHRVLIDQESLDILIGVERIDDSDGHCKRTVLLQSWLHRCGTIRDDGTVRRDFGCWHGRSVLAGVFLLQGWTKACKTHYLKKQRNLSVWNWLNLR